MSDPLKPLISGLSPALDRLTRQAAAAESLTARVQAELPEAVRSRVMTATRREADLVVIVDSAAWAARVRYAGPQLKARLEAAGEPAIGRLRVKVRGRSA